MEAQSVLVLVLWFVFSSQFYSDFVNCRVWICLLVVTLVSVGVLHWFVLTDEKERSIETAILIITLSEYLFLFPKRLFNRIIDMHAKKYKPGSAPTKQSKDQNSTNEETNLFFTRFLFYSVLWWIFSIITGVELFIVISSVSCAVQFADYVVSYIQTNHIY